MEILLKSSSRAPCIKILQIPCIRPCDAHFVRACGMEMHMDRSEEQFLCKHCRTIAVLNWIPVLCVLSKCTWACHRNNFTREWKGKMPVAKECSTYRKNTSSWTHCCGKMVKQQFFIFIVFGVGCFPISNIAFRMEQVTLLLNDLVPHPTQKKHIFFFFLSAQFHQR